MSAMEHMVLFSFSAGRLSVPFQNGGSVRRNVLEDLPRNRTSDNVFVSILLLLSNGNCKAVSLQGDLVSFLLKHGIK